ncbi:hypothetical protein EGW08_000458, partial [Elysia chlorotica]
KKKKSIDFINSNTLNFNLFPTELQRYRNYQVTDTLGTKIKKKTHVCSICSKAFVNSRILKGHINSVHLDIRPYTCKYCSRGFSYENNLNNHVKMCDKAYIYHSPSS